MVSTLDSEFETGFNPELSDPIMRVRSTLEPAFVAQLVEHPFSKREVMRSKLIESMDPSKS